MGNDFVVTHRQFVLQAIPPMPSGNVSTTTITPPQHKSSPSARLWLGGLLQSRTLIVPTWRGWALLLVLTSFVVCVFGRSLCAFLSVQDSVPGGVLVVEGWVPAYAARQTLEEFRRQPYQGIYVTGEPLEEGNPYIGFGNYADFTAAKLQQAGAPPGSVHAVPAPFVGKDRTYTTALFLKKRLEAEGISLAKVNVVSIGPHARRSRLLYQMAFGSATRVGMIAIPDRDYDPDHWWKTSAGVRSVISEAIAYGYARLLFRPSAE